MTGDMLYSCLGNTAAMLVNKDTFANIGNNIDEFYQQILDGKWTFDDFSAYATEAYSDLDGDGEMLMANDNFGYITQSWFGPMMALFNGGGHIAQFDAEGQPYLTLNTERNIEIYDSYFRLIDSDAAIIDTDYGHYLSTANVFANGQSLFCDVVLDMMIYFREMDNNYGIIPCPKYDESQDRYYGYG